VSEARGHGSTLDGARLPVISRLADTGVSQDQPVG
jgi:hypothetical protein